MVSSSDTVYVIGNYVVNVYTSPLIASFKDNIWKEVGNLYLVRRNAAAILYDSQVMIVGGQSYKQPEFTEIWKEDFSSGNTTEPILPASHYERITLLLVDEGFCKKEPPPPKAVLMLSTSADDNVPYVISFNGILI